MSLEQHIKNLLGEYNYQLCVQQQQLLEVISERNALRELVNKENKQTKDEHEN